MTSTQSLCATYSYCWFSKPCRHRQHPFMVYVAVPRVAHLHYDVHVVSVAPHAIVAFSDIGRLLFPTVVGCSLCTRSELYTSDSVHRQTTPDRRCHTHHRRHVSYYSCVTSMAGVRYHACIIPLIIYCCDVIVLCDKCMSL